MLCGAFSPNKTHAINPSSSLRHKNDYFINKKAYLK
jgi:hypothetical protein